MIDLMKKDLVSIVCGVMMSSNMSQDSLAEKYGISRGTVIRMIYKNYGELSLKMLCSVAVKMGFHLSINACAKEDLPDNSPWVNVVDVFPELVEDIVIEDISPKCKKIIGRLCWCTNN